MRIRKPDEYRLTRRLIAAARTADLDLIDLVLARGIEINQGNHSGTTPLMAAARSGRVDAIRHLLARGAKIDAWSNQGLTALMLAAERGQNNVVRLLLENGAAVDANDSHGETALFKAAQQGHASTCDLLLKRGGSPKIRTKFLHFMPLTAASKKGHLDVVRTLLAHGVDPDDRCGTGPPPLVVCRSVQVADLLLRRGADLNTAVYYGYTPLMMAACIGQADLVRLYLEKRADVSIRDGAGRTALTFARYSHDETTISLLRRAGATE